MVNHFDGYVGVWIILLLHILLKAMGHPLLNCDLMTSMSSSDSKVPLLVILGGPSSPTLKPAGLYSSCASPGMGRPPSQSTQASRLQRLYSDPWTYLQHKSVQCSLLHAIQVGSYQGSESHEVLCSLPLRSGPTIVTARKR